MGTLIAAFLLLLGLNVDNPEVMFPYSISLSVLQAIKTTGSGNTPSALSAGKLCEAFRGVFPEPEILSEYICAVIYTYHCFLCVAAPVSIVSALVSRFVHFFSNVLVWWRAHFLDTYVFDELSEPTLALAKSVRSRYEEPGKSPRRRGGVVVNLVFAEETHSVEDDLHVRAIELGATCVRHPVDTVWRYLPRRKEVHLVLSSKDEERNITRASAIRRNACEERERLEEHERRGERDERRARDECPSVSVYAVCSLREAESLFDQGAGGSGGGGHVSVRYVDWTRNVVEQTLERYPLSLLGCQPEGSEQAEGCARPRGSAAEQPKRHVVVVGAGHVGIEFLRRALQARERRVPDGSEALQYRFDVLDNKADPLHKDENGKPECLAKHRFLAQTGGTYDLEELSCHFRLCDALGDTFLGEIDGLDERDDPITYAFVSLGDDFVTVQVSLRIREHFKGKRASSGLPRPVIVAVLDDEELCASLKSDGHGGSEYRINAMGAPEDMYTYSMVFEIQPTTGAAEGD